VYCYFQVDLSTWLYRINNLRPDPATGKLTGGKVVNINWLSKLDLTSGVWEQTFVETIDWGGYSVKLMCNENSNAPQCAQYSSIAVYGDNL